MLGRIARTDVAREINRQAEIVHEAGLRPTHLDGHQHLHLLPGVLEVCLQVCRSYHIPFIRIPGAGMLTTSQPIQWGRRLQFCLLRILAMRQRAKLAKVPVRCCDGVWGLLEAGRLSAQAVASLLDGIGAGLHEFVTHPATEPPRDCLRYPWGYQWTEELAALQSDELRQALQRNCIELTDFRTEARRQGAVAEGSG